MDFQYFIYLWSPLSNASSRVCLIGHGESTYAHSVTAAASDSLKPVMLKDKPQMVFEECPLITIQELALFRSLV